MVDKYCIIEFKIIINLDQNFGNFPNSINEISIEVANFVTQFLRQLICEFSKKMSLPLILQGDSFKKIFSLLRDAKKKLSSTV